MDLIFEGIRQAVALLLGGDPAVWQIIWTSLTISGVATGISVLIGVPLGVGLALGRFRGRGPLLGLANAGMGLPPVAVGLFVALLLARNGVLGDLRLLYTPNAMVIAQVVIAAPVVISLSAAAIQALPPTLPLQLRALGASWPQVLWLLVREARLSLLAAVMAGFGAVISEVGASMMVGGNLVGSTRVLTTATVLAVQRGDFATAIALSLILLGLIVFVTGVLTSLQQRGQQRGRKL